LVNEREMKRWLAAKGCTFENHAGGSGHLTVRCGDRVSQLPMHGKGKELGTGLVQKILKDLGLKESTTPTLNGGACKEKF